MVELIARGDFHYLAWLRLKDRIAKKIEPNPNGCWLWTGAMNRQGYAWFQFRHHRVMVHKFVYEVCVATIPDGLFVLHNCPAGDNPTCCNPAHLWLGTKGDNIRDCVKKGRHPDAKIKPEQVEEIRRRLAVGRHGIVKQLAEEYGVKPTTICKIRKGLTWNQN